MPNTYACKLVSNPNVPIFLPRVCTLVLFIIHVQVYFISRAPVFRVCFFYRITHAQYYTHKKEKSVNQSRTKVRTVNIRGER